MASDKKMLDRPPSEDPLQCETIEDIGAIEDEATVKRINRKIDRRICIVLGVLYTIAVIDRVNLPLAEGNAYSLLILCFFPFYIAFQPVMTPISRKLRPRRFLSGIVISWGLVMAGHGLVHDWRAMLALRCLLGIFEAGFFSTSVYLISTWYIRSEVATRNAAFYLVGVFFAGFGGVLAYGLSRMDGVGGYAGWRWIFIIEGIITIVGGCLAYILIVDFPEQAAHSWKFLTEEEARIIIERVERDRGDTIIPPFELWPYLANALDWKIWFFAANFGLTSTVTYATAYFMPIILREDMGFSEVATQCLSTPAVAVAAILGQFEAYLSDRFRLRSPFMIFNAALIIIGIILLGFVEVTGVRFFGCFLIVGGANANIPLTLTYQANNIVGQWKRAFCSATLIGAGAVGGIIGSLTFRSQDAPAYRPGLYTCLTAGALVILSVLITTAYFAVSNKRQRQGKLIIEKMDGFRYTH
ncbi:retrograde regulation protein 2 [Eremomyces bilateralis CBS 781.70]|uniref:Retrograde regulation protein 2 n=1 Tax=Eremomyces bilateralis CBS 781.70 TaxID=1392243 RepID=A0A6G1GFQ3_9PEZI|nr:retrograde regulation protein 2 [Eremomyces bilateralis CBS 781.70]KAF1816883.1 retrograde regulation protein 2 [Eremomyces bilateralis CBS 781.70]